MSQDSLIGKQFADYRLEELLGQGGMARVYKGLNTRLKRLEAIKVIDTQFRDDDEYTRRFVLEAQAIAQLSHPHVVTVFQTGHVDNVLYMAMQYIDGSDVAQVLERYEANDEFINPEEALKIIHEIGSALDYIHSQGIIHRDIKPANILLDPSGRAILTDFGLALMTEIGTRGEIFGTPHYLSPEQAISSGAVVNQSDIYSLGIIAYRMFTGILPFASGEPLDIALQHLNDPVPNPREFRPELSDELVHVLLKVLDKDADERYQTGQAFADALASALNTTPDITRRTSLPRLSIPEIVQLDLDEQSDPLPQADAPSRIEISQTEDNNDTLPHSSPPTAPKAVIPDATRKPTVTRNQSGAVAPAPRATNTMKAIKEPTFIERYGMPAGIILVISAIILIALFLMNGNPQTTDEVVTAPTDIPVTEIVATQDIIPTNTLVAPAVLPTDIPATDVLITEVVPTVTDPTSTPSAIVIPMQLTASDDVLLIHNQSTTQSLDLSPLRFTDSSTQVGIGGGFTVTSLAPDECVAYTSSSVIVYTPTTCTLIETFTITDNSRLIWRNDYRILYQNGFNGESIATCQPNASCTVSAIIRGE